LMNMWRELICGPSICCINVITQSFTLLKYM
jgi:hypothetical protein